MDDLIDKMKRVSEQESLERLNKITTLLPYRMDDAAKVRLCGSEAFAMVERENSCNDGVLLDVEDVKAALFGRSLILHTLIEADTHETALEQVKLLIQELESKNLALGVADGVVMYFRMSPSVLIIDLADIAQAIFDAIEFTLKGEPTNGSANLFWGSRSTKSLKNGSLLIDIFISYQHKEITYKPFC